ncbi:hypothetical protein EIP91_005304 [Steccherinum ochraceum]|uniref:Uncharacterized protein n=1 Tax=Steccherinum ochraceum TaxID=92696 RepID=A0A4R0RMK2_9APHY|nr:hypothetical protein EIP91_005304 [Steccherinum ochraceum]
MSGSSRHARTLSPPLSTAYSSTNGAPVKLNIVTRVAIEGEARRGADMKADGAEVKMFLKMTIPLDGVAPGSTIPLFPEENVKILDSQVHPLDSNSAPYNFSSSACTLLHRGARALNLPARQRVLYTSLFGSVSSASSSSSNPPQLEERYVGHVTVSGYHVAYVVPRELPPRLEELQSRSPGHRRMSTSTSMQFMAAIKMWIPFQSKPPHSPYLLSIPTPRCLHNHVKLRIFPPVNQSLISASLASLSSAEDEPNQWDVTSDPHVTRTTTPSRHRRNHSQQSYTHFADDESSDSSTSGFPDGCGLQGTFQSAERIRIRWAKLMKPDEISHTADGRVRVGVRDVSGATTCVVQDSGEEQGKGKGRSTMGEGSIVMNVEYNAVCKGVWFPGVATVLGMDVGLDVGDCDVDWAPEGPRKWTVSGSTGFTGFAVGAPEILSKKFPVPPSRQSSVSDSTFLLPSSPDGGIAGGTSLNAMRSGSSASLMRVPLPTQTVPDYSFEGSPSITPTSSIASLPTAPSSPEKRRGSRSRASSFGDGIFTDTDNDQDLPAKPPDMPITIHVNMNDLSPSTRNALEFSIIGQVVVTPRKLSSELTDKNPIVLPRFHVLHSDRESTSILLRSQLESASIDVYTAKGNITHAQSRKTVVQPGGQTQCGSDGARIAIRSTQSPATSSIHSPYGSSRDREDSLLDEDLMFKTPRTNGLLGKSVAGSVLRRTSMFSPSRPTRDGPLMIPSVTATVTHLASNSEQGEISRDYAVRACLPAPSDTESEWLEFGLAVLSSSASGPAAITPADLPEVHVTSVSIEGVPVHYEAKSAAKEANTSPSGTPLDETGEKKWASWVKIHIGEGGGGNVEIVYLVRNSSLAIKEEGKKGKTKAKDLSAVLDVLLPTFHLPVGRLEVHVETQSGFDIAAIHSNFTQQNSSATGKHLTHYSMPEFFDPQLSLTIQPSTFTDSRASTSYLWRVVQILAFALPTAMAIMLFVSNLTLEQELTRAKQSLLNHPDTHVETVIEAVTPSTVTFTSTVVSVSTATTTATTSVRWWAEPSSSEPAPPSIVTTTVYLPAPTPTTSEVPVYTATTVSTSPSSTNTFDIALQDLPFLWPVRFEFPSLDEASQVARVALQKTWVGFGFAYRIFNYIVHFPLGPEA